MKSIYILEMEHLYAIQKIKMYGQMIILKKIFIMKVFMMKIILKIVIMK
jgi:hypothetical protein